MTRRSAALLLLPLGLSLSALPGCGGEEEDPPPPPIGAAVVEAPPAEHGGSVTVVGDRYPVEVVTHRSGQVYAYSRWEGVLGEGAPPPEGLEMTITVPTAGRSTGRPVRLRWSPTRHRWEGRVRRLEIVPGPVDITIVIGGVPCYGHIDIIVVMPAIEIHIDEHHHHHKHKHKHRHHH